MKIVRTTERYFNLTTQAIKTYFDMKNIKSYFYILISLFLIGTITILIGVYNAVNGKEILGSIQIAKGTIYVLFCYVFYYLDSINSKINK